MYPLARLSIIYSLIKTIVQVLPAGYSSLLGSRRLNNLLNSERIHCRVLELPSRNLALKQNVKLRIATALGLWQAEKCPRKT